MVWAYVQKSKLESEKRANAMELKKESNDKSEQELFKLVQCFDIKANWRQMFAIDKGSSTEVPIVNGLRTVAAFLILFTHVNVYMLPTVNNRSFLQELLEGNKVENFTILMVECFFTISGFLQTYNFLSNTKKLAAIQRNTFLQNTREFFKMLLHRYIRLAPLFFITILLMDLGSAYLHDVSVHHIFVRYDQLCPQYWWRNMLFINSFYPHKEMCVDWTWFLSCEMWYYVLATILLYCYVKRPQLIKRIVLIIFACNIVWSLHNGIRSNVQFQFEVFNNVLDYVYLDPIVRSTTYILGSLTAWYLSTKQSALLSMGSMKSNVLWYAALICIPASGITMYWRELDPITSICLYIFGRLLLSLAICWMVVGSSIGHGCCWSRLLEAKHFRHFNRSTYTIYLLNPLIITIFVSLMESSQQVNGLSLILYSCGFAIITYLLAILVSLLFEVPFCNLSNFIRNYGKNKIV